MKIYIHDFNLTWTYFWTLDRPLSLSRLQHRNWQSMWRRWETLWRRMQFQTRGLSSCCPYKQAKITLKTTNLSRLNSLLVGFWCEFFVIMSKCFFTTQRGYRADVAYSFSGNFSCRFQSLLPLARESSHDLHLKVARDDDERHESQDEEG